MRQGPLAGFGPGEWLLAPRHRTPGKRLPAQRQAQEVGAGRAVVTACPAARRMFEKAGAEALALETVLARYFGGGDE